LDEKAKNEAILSVEGANGKTTYVPIRNRSNSNTSRSLDRLSRPKSRGLYPSIPRKDVESSETIIKPTANPFNQENLSTHSDPEHPPLEE
jgi:hypothetical protein